MKGSYLITVGTNKVKYRFQINRNITILKGNSATGKTSLINLIAEHSRFGEKSGVNLSSDKKCLVLDTENWEKIVSEEKECICFADEDNEFLKTKEFARLAQKSDNYYVLAIRDNLENLPYSVDEVYELKNVTKGYGKIKRMYTCFHRMYESKVAQNLDIVPDVVICEDSKAGYDFFKTYFTKYGIKCITSKGKSNFPSEILKTNEKDTVLIIGDGAAFGSEMDKVLKLERSRRLLIFLPESFEWMILSSGIVQHNDLKKILEETSDYVESEKYFSWEQFFTATLIEMTKGSYLKYNKDKINEVYLQEKNSSAIADKYLKVEKDS